MTVIDLRTRTSVPRVLLVDDRADNLLALEAALEPLGYDLTTASSGPEALRWLLESEVDAIVLDVQMPDMDGFETAELIKSRARNRDIPIVFLTAVYNDVSHQLRGFELGAADYLCKPVEPAVLRAKLQATVASWSRLRRLEREHAAQASLPSARGDRAPLSALGSRGFGGRPEERGSADPSRGDPSGVRNADGARVAMEREVELTFGPDPDELARCRDAVRASLDAQGSDICDAVCLIVSELVTNAIVHGASPIVFRLDVGKHLARGEVVDASSKLPRPGEPYDVAASGGRGLHLVERFATRWGWTCIEGGKVVWFELELSSLAH